MPCEPVGEHSVGDYRYAAAHLHTGAPLIMVYGVCWSTRDSVCSICVVGREWSTAKIAVELW